MKSEKTGKRNYKETCQRGFRLYLRKKLIIPNTDFQARWNWTNAVFTFCTVIPKNICMF